MFLHRFFFIQSLFSLVLICDLQAEENLYSPLDDRKWKIGYQDATNDESITELILLNEDINNWNELFTVQRYDHLAVSSNEFISLLEKMTKKNIPSTDTLKFEIIEGEPQNIFESSFISKKNNPQTIVQDEYNIGRVIKGKEGLYYLRYSSKDAQQFNQNKKMWIEILKKAYLADSPKEGSQVKWFTFTPTTVEFQGKPLVSQSDYQLLDNPYENYQLSLPKNWKVSKPNRNSKPNPQNPNRDIVLFSDPSQDIEGKVTILNLETNGKITLAQYLKNYQKEHPNQKVVEKGNLISIIGQEGEYLIVVDGNRKGWITCFRTDKSIYRLELWTDLRQFDKMKDLFKNISLNFHGGSNTF